MARPVSRARATARWRSCVADARMDHARVRRRLVGTALLPVEVFDRSPRATSPARISLRRPVTGTTCAYLACHPGAGTESLSFGLEIDLNDSLRDAGVSYEPARCAFCDGSGKRGYEICPSCLGGGSCLVAQPRTTCAYCEGSGKKGYERCSACEGSGWAHSLRPRKEPGSVAAAQDVAVANAQNAQWMARSLGSDVWLMSYAVGFFLAFGLNWSDSKKNALEALLYALLSWINVGYHLAR